MQKTKELLSQAIKSLSDDYSLSEVKFYLKTAYRKLEEAEKKQEKKIIKQENLKKQPVIMPFQLKQTIDILDNMIADEKQKLERFNDNDIQTILD